VINSREFVRSDEVKTEIEALVERKKRLQLFLQPVMSISNKKVFGYEVLSRGAPGSILEDFSPFIYAGDYNLGKKLDRVALETIIKNIKNFPDAYIFINSFLSNLGFLHELLKSISGDYKVVIEIDFSTELVEINEVLENVVKIKELTFASFAIDDLGKYSLDPRLYDLIMPEFLKVDICLTRGISEDVTKQKVLDDILILSNEIGSRLILEGVEERSDSNYLKTQGFELAQGNIFQRPREYSFFTRVRS